MLKNGKNSRLRKISSKEDHYEFSWKLFSSWDYMIGNAEMAKNKAAEITTNLRVSSGKCYFYDLRLYIVVKIYLFKCNVM